MKVFTSLLLAMLLAVVVAQEKGKKGGKFKKAWKECAEVADCKEEMFAPLKEASGTLSEDESMKKCVFCMMTKMEMAKESGEINKEKCEKFAGHMSKKREDKKDGLVACCKTTEGVAPVESVFNVLKCWKKAVEPEALFHMKGKGKCKGKDAE